MPNRAAQYALPLSVASAGADRIVVGNANAAALDLLRKPDRWPFHTCILEGAPRSGKSLIARWFAAQHEAATVIDDAPKMAEADLFHAWNRAQATSAPLLLTVGIDPLAAGEGDMFGTGGWTVRLPDLRSRLGAALHCAIGLPDEAMMADLLRVHAERRSLALPDASVDYLVTRSERSFAVAEAIVAAVDRLSLERKQAPSLAICRDALDAVQGPAEPNLL